MLGFEMNMRQKSGKERGCDVGERVVLVAVKACKEIPRSALVWALTHVVQPGDCAKLLVVIPAHSSSNLLCTFIYIHIWRYLSLYISWFQSVIPLIPMNATLPSSFCCP